MYPEFFAAQPGQPAPEYQTGTGIYAPAAASTPSHMSWGHDEYLYHVVKDHLPLPAQYMIRYHSFYAWHREGEYGYLLNDDGPRDAALGAEVQPLRPLHQESRCGPTSPR